MAPPSEQDEFADELDRCADQKMTAALRLAQAATGHRDERTLVSLLRAAAKYAMGARGDRARARALRG